MLAKTEAQPQIQALAGTPQQTPLPTVASPTLQTAAQPPSSPAPPKAPARSARRKQAGQAQQTDPQASLAQPHPSQPSGAQKPILQSQPAPQLQLVDLQGILQPEAAQQPPVQTKSGPSETCQNTVETQQTVTVLVPDFCDTVALVIHHLSILSFLPIHLHPSINHVLASGITYFQFDCIPEIFFASHSTYLFEVQFERTSVIVKCTYFL